MSYSYSETAVEFNQQKALGFSVLQAILIVLLSVVINTVFKSNLFDPWSLLAVAAVGSFSLTTIYYLHSLNHSFSSSFLVVTCLVSILGLIGIPLITTVILLGVSTYTVYQQLKQNSYKSTLSPRITGVMILVAVLTASYNLGDKFLLFDTLSLSTEALSPNLGGDLLKDMAFATMYHNHGIVSSGLHGTPPANIAL